MYYYDGIRSPEPYNPGPPSEKPLCFGVSSSKPNSRKKGQDTGEPRDGFWIFGPNSIMVAYLGSLERGFRFWTGAGN